MAERSDLRITLTAMTHTLRITPSTYDDDDVFSWESSEDCEVSRPCATKRDTREVREHRPGEHRLTGVIVLSVRVWGTGVEVAAGD